MKSLLRNKANFSILEGFLTALFKRFDEANDIKVIAVLESESNKEEKDNRSSRVDLLAEDEKGAQILVEVQKEKDLNWIDRVLFSSSRIIVDNLGVGDPFQEIKKVVTITIAYFPFSDAIDPAYCYKGKFIGSEGHTLNMTIEQKNEETKQIEKIDKSKKIPIHYFINVWGFKDQIHCDLDEWVYLFKHSSVKKEFHSKNIHTAEEKLKVTHMSPEERRSYNRFLITKKTKESELQTALSDAEIKGIKIGEKKGEKKKAIEIAKGLLASGIDKKVVAKTTGLSSKEIAALK